MGAERRITSFVPKALVRLCHHSSTSPPDASCTSTCAWWGAASAVPLLSYEKLTYTGVSVSKAVTELVPPCDVVRKAESGHSLIL